MNIVITLRFTFNYIEYYSKFGSKNIWGHSSDNKTTCVPGLFNATRRFPKIFWLWLFCANSWMFFIYLFVDKKNFNFVIVCLTHNVLYYLYHRWVWVPKIKFWIEKKSLNSYAVDYTSGVLFLNFCFFWFLYCLIKILCFLWS